MKLVVFITAVFMISCYGKKPEVTGKEGKPLPAFKILMPDSATWVNTKDIQPGKATVIFLFGPQCPYCKKQIKDIVNKIDDLKDIQFYVITPYPFNQMKDFYKNYNLQDYSNIITGIDPANFFGNYIDAITVPYISIYNKNNKLVKSYKGLTSIKQIKRDVLN